jgi:hypothetical protein
MSDIDTPALAGIEAEKLELERERLKLDRYKAQLDYKKFVLGSVFVALAIAAIPPLFQLATAALEYVKSNSDRQAKQQAFRDDYIKDFIGNALNQDIELRIRFAQYFARVSTEPYRNDWNAYLEDLRRTRSELRSEIDKMETEWRLKAGTAQRDEVEIARLERNLAWAYAEVGYVERNRSAAVNPRAPESNVSGGLTGTLLMGRFADPTYYLLQPFSWSPKPGSEAAAKFEPVRVPAGFVFTLDSIPQVFWSSLRPDGTFAQAAVVHDYLYWTQTRSRSEADEIFRLAMQDLPIDPKTVAMLSAAARSGGQTAWDANAKLKASGEQRILKEFPVDPKTTWTDWKRRPGVFASPTP